MTMTFIPFDSILVAVGPTVVIPSTFALHSVMLNLGGTAEQVDSGLCPVYPCDQQWDLDHGVASPPEFQILILGGGKSVS